MRKSILGLSALALVAVSAPAFAQDEADDGLGLTITGGAALVSDYRFRGVSQSNEDWAVQGNVTVSHSSGLYAGFWGSTNAGQGEIDIIGGFTHEIVPGLTGDIGVTYYLYPNRATDGTASCGPLENAFTCANELVEPYVSLSTTFGPASAKLGFAWAPKQEYFQDSTGANNDNTYLWTDLGVMVPSTPVKLSGHLGWTSNHALRETYFDANSSRADVIDYSIGASVAYKALTFGVSWIGTDVPSRFAARENNGLTGGADSTVVFSIGASF